jgi:hypothetical protein
VVAWGLVHALFVPGAPPTDLLPFREIAVRSVVVFGWFLFNGMVIKTIICELSHIELQDAHIGYVEPLFPNIFRIGIKTMAIFCLMMTCVADFNFGGSFPC